MKQRGGTAFLRPFLLADDFNQFGEDSGAGFTKVREILGNFVHHDGCLRLIPHMASPDGRHPRELLVGELLIPKSNPDRVLGNGD